MENSREELKGILQEIGHNTMHRSMGGFFQFAKKYNLSFSQMIILSRLYKWETVSVSEISSMLDISHSAVSQLLDKLVQSGLIERRDDENDRRKKNHIITGKGREMVSRSITARSLWIEDLLAGFTEEETEEMLPVLIKLTEKIRKLDPVRSHHHCRNYHKEKK